MKRLLLLSVLLLFIVIDATSQNKNRITGTVYDNSTKEAIIQGGVRVLSPKDSTFVTGAATDLNGKFSVSVNPGNYIINISYIGYREEFLNIDATRRNVNLENIFLNDDGILLKEAVVTAKAAEIVVKGDTVEYNADSYKVQESAVVEDLLKKMPGAEVDSEGKITINGKEVKKILVDGKEFFSSDPKVASKNLPAQMVDKLQVLDRKTDMAQMTGFDDGEEETVINLTVKRGMKEGLFGNATAGAGNHDRYGISGLANYMRNDNQFTILANSNNTNNEGFTDNAGGSFRGMRGGGMNFGGQNGITKSTSGGGNFAITSSDKLKWGGNLRVGDTKNNVESNSFTQRYMADSLSTRGDQYENRKNVGESKSTNIGADLRFEWTPDSLTKVIFSPNIQYGKNRSFENSDYLTTYENPNDSVNWGRSRNFSEGNTTSASGRLEVSRKLNNKGRVLSFSISGGLSNTDYDGTNWSETYFRKELNDSTSLIDQMFNQKNKSHNWRGYLSYVEPIGRNNFIQLNYSYRKNYTESDKETFLNDGTGYYSIIDTTSTKKLENNFVNQEIGVNFKSVRAKYNYTVGIAIQPSSSESWTITPSKQSKVSNNVVNFSPVAQFNYMWDKRHNLRLNYNGSTTQPTATQLSDVRDESDPMNITYGNPNLKPAFSNRFRIRYQKFNPEQASAFMAFGGFNFTTNDIVSTTLRHENGSQETTYKNINGNWETNLRVIFNRPLRNKKFSVNSMSYVRYSENNGFVNGNKNTAKTLNFMESAGLQFRSDFLDFGLRGNFNYSNTGNTISKQQDIRIYNYGGSFNTTAYLPHNFTIETDIAYSANSGTSQGYEKNEWLWNASVSKQIFKAKTGTIRFNIYDILQQRTNISQSASATQFRETITNTLNSYFMVSFSYKFQIFKGGAKMTDMDNGGYGGRGNRPPGGGPPRRF
ncbi:MAG: outer membrane beta-barrel protein [Dysgonomonas sp.]|nr:outer membrane beta-barrel protein [Dysgonomonas sp.]